jgi:hypothetical protein
MISGLRRNNGRNEKVLGFFENESIAHQNLWGTPRQC